MFFLVIIIIGALTKVAENASGYIRPDGSSTSSPYSKSTGFNQEDWLNRANNSRSDYKMFTDFPNPIFKADGVQTYSHLPGVLRAKDVGIQSFSANDPYGHLALICKNNLIGYFKKITRMNENYAEMAFQRLDSNGIRPIREKEAGGNLDAWSGNISKPINCLNVRYSPEDLVLFENPISLSAPAVSGFVTVTYGSDQLKIKEQVLENALKSNWNKLFY